MIRVQLSCWLIQNQNIFQNLTMGIYVIVERDIIKIKVEMHLQFL